VHLGAEPDDGLIEHRATRAVGAAWSLAEPRELLDAPAVDRGIAVVVSPDDEKRASGAADGRRAGTEPWGVNMAREKL
jgi:hypothetical protein